MIRTTYRCFAVGIVLCTFGPIVHVVLQQTRGLRDSGWTFLVSLPHSIRALQLGLYDVGGQVEALGIQVRPGGPIEELMTDNSPTRAALWLAAVSVLCLLLLLRRVDAPTRI